MTLVIAAIPIENLSLNMASIQIRSPFGFVFGDHDCAGDCRVHSRSVRFDPRKNQGVIMTNTEIETKKPVSMWKVRALGLLAMGSGLIVSAASAVAINLTPVTLIIEDITLLFVPLVAVVIAALPIIIVLSIIGFIVGLLDAILGKIKV